MLLGIVRAMGVPVAALLLRSFEASLTFHCSSISLFRCQPFSVNPADLWRTRNSFPVFAILGVVMLIGCDLLNSLSRPLYLLAGELLPVVIHVNRSTHSAMSNPDSQPRR